MSAPVIESHLELARTIRTMFANPYRPSSDAAQIIAESEAKAVAGVNASLDAAIIRAWGISAERDQLRAEVERLKKQIKDDNLSYGCELRDPYGTIWEQATKDHDRAGKAERALAELREWQAGVIANERLHHAERKDAIARAESAEREAEEQCLLNGKGAEREAGLLGQLERSAREIEQKRNLLTVAIKSAGDQATRAERAESELAGIRALANRRNKRDHSEDTTHQLVAALDQALDIAQAELAATKSTLDEEVNCAEKAEHEVVRQYARAERAEADLATERARLDWLLLDVVSRFDDAYYNRAAIEAAIKEDTK